MLLLIDSGNTRLKWCLADEANAGARFHLNGAIDYCDFTVEFLRSLPSQDISDVLVSSVAGEEKDSLLVDYCEQTLGLVPKFARVSRLSCGVTNNYQTLDRLGVDRWVAAIGSIDGADGETDGGSLAAKNNNRIIIDAGTAVTVDVVDARSEFLGGVILPGRSLMRRSLVGETAGISADINSVNSVIGVNTQDCVNAGIRYGLIGGLAAIIDEIMALVVNNKAWEAVVCGGDGDWVLSHLETSIQKRREPLLIFRGLLNMRNLSLIHI